PHPLTPAARMAHEPHIAECLEVTRDRLTRHPVPSLRRVIESGPSADRRPSRRSLVASPSAANSGAALPLLDIAREVLDLTGPPVVVHAERLGAARERNAIEPGFDDRERGALRG